MRPKFRVPLAAVAIALLALIGLLATLQYRWLGRISEAEREQMRATLAHRAREFAQDFDREVTRAFLLFQTDPLRPDQDAATRIAEGIERWQTSSSFPRLVKAFYLIEAGGAGRFELQRFDPATKNLRVVPWPESMRDWPEQFAERVETASRGAFAIRRMAGPVWEQVPAIVVPMPVLVLTERVNVSLPFSAHASYTVLELDLEYIRREMLPALAQRHFRVGAADSGRPPVVVRQLRGDADFDAHLAVVSESEQAAIHYQSSPAFEPAPGAKADVSAELFQVRMQDFNTMAAEIRRFTALSTVHVTAKDVRRPEAAHSAGSPPVSILVQPAPRAASGRLTSTITTRAHGAGGRWKLLVKHPAGSLETAVNAARRRNLVVSMSILAVLGASMGLLVLSTRRAQRLARLQMEFVAAVSHELRTPLAVIRSAGENLADGVVRDDAHIRRYGELVRSEGRRLSEMVEQILELAGIQFGQRGMNMRAVSIAPLLQDVVSSSSALIEAADMRVEFDLPDALPPVLGDESALRRVFQNLVGNAIKYGKDGRKVVLRARTAGSRVAVSVIDRGLGIAPVEQARIFDPFYRAADVIAAQIQGAGLGLSLVKRIVETHGGSIEVNSAPGAGSEFIVTLPAAAESGDRNQETDTRQEAEGGRAEEAGAGEPGAARC